MYLKHSTPLYWIKSPLHSRRFRGQTVAIAITACRSVLLRRQREFLNGLRGVINIADDICVYGCGETNEDAYIDHHRNLAQLLEKCAEHDVWLSAKKTSVQIPIYHIYGAQAYP